MKLVFFFSTTWTQGWYNPGCLAAVKFRTGVELRRGPAIHPPSSSRVALNVIFNFTAEVLLGGSTATVTWALQGWNVLEFTWTRAAGAPHCRVKPQQGTALPDSPESLLRGVVLHRNLHWGMKWEKSLRYTHTACYPLTSASRETTQFWQCVLTKHRDAEQEKFCHGGIPVQARHTPHSWNVIPRLNLTAWY